ncbi:hypothetical protein TOPH_06423 [Tolypocladium ophioglossoides CBS 100239]|uniref:CENP-V/GFA domain-containing protein n=1 Tax=Tolypocladium ophioglossoides (strain CBS 100239) TaxID=1163406 RepID=A0A0L0N451_TOLOC|nr:hypothetical protein TOPH_06423 [Tolypocladium ophioglossoides CBS 100239]
MADANPTRVPFTGSCHCGAIRYILFLTLPHPHSETLPPPKGVQRFYRCNCTVCHKMGHMHIRPASPTDDFLLLSPLDPFRDLGDYQCYDKVLHFFYCKTCAVRCFIFGGEGEVVDVDLAALGVSGAGQAGKGTKAWRPKRDGGRPKYGNYLSVNGHSVDAGQKGFDMRELTDKKYVLYCDCLSDKAQEAPARYGRPQDYGSY